MSKYENLILFERIKVLKSPTLSPKIIFILFSDYFNLSDSQKYKNQ